MVFHSLWPLGCLFLIICLNFLHCQSVIVLHRRVCIFPKGNDVAHLPVYLEVADSAALPEGWSKYAKFSVAVISQLNNKFNVTKGTLIPGLLYLFAIYRLLISFTSLLEIV